jgi:hypothetical protein
VYVFGFSFVTLFLSFDTKLFDIFYVFLCAALFAVALHLLYSLSAAGVLVVIFFSKASLLSFIMS